MLGYQYSFGDSIASFSGPTDIFSISIRRLGKSYFIFFGAFIASIIFFRAKYGYYVRSDYIDSLPDEEQTAARARFLSDRKFYKWLAIINIVMGTIAVMFWWYTRQIFPYAMLSIPVEVGAILCLVWAGNRIGWSHLEFVTVLAGTLVLLMCTFRGLADGQDDLYVSYSESLRISPTCKDVAILRPQGETFSRCVGIAAR